MKNKNNKIIYFLPAIFIMCVIFFLSHQPAEVSSSISGGILTRLSETLSSKSSRMQPESYHTFFRKSAHFSVYFLLSCSLIFAFAKNNVKKLFFFVLLLSFAFALSDEFHQLFIKGRSGELRDVLIDTSGATLALIIFSLFQKNKRIK